jgi:hypothetical protein
MSHPAEKTAVAGGKKNRREGNGPAVRKIKEHRATKWPCSGKLLKGRSTDSDFLYQAPAKSVEILTVNIDMLRGAPTVRMNIAGFETEFIIDTGSSVSLIQPGVSGSEIKASSVLSIGVTGDPLQIKGEQEVKFGISGANFMHNFKVCPLPTEAHGILGTDFLTKVKASLDIENKQLILKVQPRLSQYVSEPL